MHCNLVSNMPLCQAHGFHWTALSLTAFPQSRTLGRVDGVWLPIIGASAEPRPNPTLASARQGAIISGAMSITWSRKAPTRLQQVYTAPHFVVHDEHSKKSQ